MKEMHNQVGLHSTMEDGRHFWVTSTQTTPLQ